MFAHGETVTRLRGTVSTDPYSGAATDIDWTSPAETEIPGCAVALGSTVDPLLTARDAVVTDFVVYADSATDVAPSDRMVIRGLTCEVVGRPFVWMNPFTGWTPGLVIKANVVEG